MRDERDERTTRYKMDGAFRHPSDERDCFGKTFLGWSRQPSNVLSPSLLPCPSKAYPCRL